MRESNFAFPGQNRACVCISSQLYDRRALDTLCPLPLFNSLTHLTYLTSTSPRIREIMTMDGGLERLVRMLHDFCMSPPPAENPALIYGLAPPSSRPQKPSSVTTPAFDRHAAYRFSLAFQSVVNIGVRGSEPIRGRVVEAGTLDVVGCILEAWLAHKGFAVGPSASATGIPRETREQRLARRQARHREEAAELARALERQIQVESSSTARRETSLVTTSRHHINETDDTSISTRSLTARSATTQGSRFDRRGSPSPDTDLSTSADTSIAATPVGSSTPTGTVLVPGRDRSGTVIGRRVWDEPAPRPRASRTHRHASPPDSASPPPSTDTSRPDTETEDDGDVDVDMDRGDRADIDDVSPSPEPRHDRRMLIQRPRRAVAIVSDVPVVLPLPGNADAHIMIGDGGGRAGEMRVEDGIVLLEPNDDFAMGAPPGAPGAITIQDGATPRNMELRVAGGGDPDRGRNRGAPDVTPRAGVTNLPPTAISAGEMAGVAVHRGGTIRGARGAPNGVAPGNVAQVAVGRSPALGLTMNRTSAHHRGGMEMGEPAPYRDEDVLLSLQLLAYLSKYPHVRQAFYKPRATFHPVATQPGSRAPNGAAGKGVPGRGGSNAGGTSRGQFAASAMLGRDSHSFLRAFTSGASRGKEKEKSSFGFFTASTPSASGSSSSAPPPPTPTRQTNVFSLVERFTFRPSSSEADLPNPPPRLPPEIQYWAGVIMRNACRKDDSRGGIRQCANMLCGRWETYPREFAKCRRCRKAKYCGKECQSTAWSEGHRFWCSAKEGEEEVPEHASGDQASATGDAPGADMAANVTLIAQDDDNGGAVGVTGGGGFWVEREQDRPIVRERTIATLAAGAEQTQAARAAATNAFRNIFSNSRGGTGFAAAANTNAPGPSGVGGGGGQSTVAQGTSGHRRAGHAGHRRGDGTAGATGGGYSLFGHQAEEAPRRAVQNVVPDGPFDVMYGRPRLRLQDMEMNGTNFGAGMGDGDDDAYGPSRNIGDDMMLE